jgi:hypothetical protein
LQRFDNFFSVSVDYRFGRIDNPFIPFWWYRDTLPTDMELEEFLKKANVHFDGVPLNGEDKEDIMTYLSVK